MVEKIKPIRFDWNEHNKLKNWKKHKVNFQECEQIFLNEPIMFFPDPKHSEEEKRLVAYGMTNKRRKLTVVFTIRNKKIRVISARSMSRKERRIYG